jgi:catechol 2,3-dioxygenase-like lactoylglutathione lyase family enzyme
MGDATQGGGSADDGRGFEVAGLAYITLYIEDYDAAVAFYTAAFGEPDCRQPVFMGWRMGETWMTVFPSKDGNAPGKNPRNMEFGIRVQTPEQVDVLHARLVELGAKNAWTPEDTEMYDRMRFSCVDDPFGVRIDVYCPLAD